MNDRRYRIARANGFTRKHANDQACTHDVYVERLLFSFLLLLQQCSVILCSEHNMHVGICYLFDHFFYVIYFFYLYVVT